MAFSGIVNGKTNFFDLLRIGVYPISFFWFLYALLIISVLQIIIDSKNNIATKYVIAIIALMLRILTYWLNTSVAWMNLNELGLFNVAKFYIWFVIGEYYLPSIIYKTQHIEKRWIRIIDICLSCMYCVIAYILYIYGVSSFTIDFLMALVGSLLVCSIAMAINQNRILEMIGKQTMPIYLFHGIMISCVRIIFMKFSIPMMNGLIPLIVCTVVGVIIPMLVYSIIKRSYILDFCIYPMKYIKEQH